MSVRVGKITSPKVVNGATSAEAGGCWVERGVKYVSVPALSRAEILELGSGGGFVPLLLFMIPHSLLRRSALVII